MTPTHKMFRMMVMAGGVALGLGMMGPGAAGASTLKNADAKSYNLRIESRTGGRALSIASDETIEKLCPEGCTMTLVGVDDATYRLEGTEMVTIETGGVVYYDGQLPPAGEAAESSAPANTAPAN